jgi:hypothetical protein
MQPFYVLGVNWSIGSEATAWLPCESTSQRGYSLLYGSALRAWEKGAGRQHCVFIIIAKSMILTEVRSSSNGIINYVVDYLQKTCNMLHA